ncbi:MAG: hypothetical protein AB9M60_10225 [Leptothrix sp. (in: b-proteobacteria)]
MSNAGLPIALVFTRDDQTWMRRSGVATPEFWAGHGVPPVRGDVLRIGGRQFEVTVRVWDTEAGQPVLRLYLSSGRADGDTAFQALAG